MTAVGFDEKLEIVKSVVSTLFNDEQIGCILYETLEAGFEENDEVIEDLGAYDDCTIISDVTNEINKNNKIIYQWNQEKDQQIIYQLLTKIFIKNIIDSTKLIQLFTSQIMINNNKSQNILLSIPNTLNECNNNHILSLSIVVAQKLNIDAKKKIIIDDVKEFFDKNKDIDGQSVKNMKAKEFIDRAKKYGIAAAKGRKLFNGINNHFNNDSVDKQSKKEEIIKWKADIHSMKDVTSYQIVYILRNHLLNNINNETVKYYSVQIEEYFSEINGKKLFELSRKDICHALEQKCENTKKIKGPAMKILKQMKEFDITKIPKSMPNAFNDDKFKLQELNLWNGQKTINECNNDEIIYIANDIIINASEKQKGLIENKESFLSFLSEHKINGEQIINYDRKQFGSAMVSHCNDNKKIKGSALKLLKAIKEYKLENISMNKTQSTSSLNSVKTIYMEEMSQLPAAQSIPFSVHQNSNILIPKSLKECKYQHIILILNKNIFPKLNQETLNENKEKIIKYIEKSQMSGKKIIEMNRKDFGSEIIQFCDQNKKLNGPIMKMYKLLREFDDFKSLSLPNGSRQSIKNVISSPPKSINECDEYWLLKIVELLVDDEKTKPYKDEITSYFKENKLNGSQL